LLVEDLLKVHQQQLQLAVEVILSLQEVLPYQVLLIQVVEQVQKLQVAVAES
jgi:hypothetical protein